MRFILGEKAEGREEEVEGPEFGSVGEGGRRAAGEELGDAFLLAGERGGIGGEEIRGNGGEGDGGEGHELADFLDGEGGLG